MTEEQIQMAVVEHLERHRAPGAEFFHVPNGGKVSIGYARKRKLLGVRAGVSDLILAHGGHTFALELKTEKGVATELQTNWLDRMERAGNWRGQVVHGLDEALETLRAWGLLLGRG